MLGGILLVCFISTCLLRGKSANQYKVILNDHLYPVMRHSYPNGTGLFQGDPKPLHRALVLSIWFEKDENDVIL